MKTILRTFFAIAVLIISLPIFFGFVDSIPYVDIERLCRQTFPEMDQDYCAQNEQHWKSLIVANHWPQASDEAKRICMAGLQDLSGNSYSQAWNCLEAEIVKAKQG